MQITSAVRLNRFPGGSQKALTFSYDDGSIHDRRLVSILNRTGLKGTFHINSGFLDQNGVLQKDEIASLFAGHEISMHSLNHPDLTTLSPNQLAYEIMSDRRNLESLAGYPVRGLSYPFGKYSDELAVTLRELGVEYARVVSGSRDEYALPEDWLKWRPTCHHKDHLGERFATFIRYDPWIAMGLFYVWGHSFEFHREDNWEIIEDFAEKAKDHAGEYWSATNIEILDYMDALSRLRLSLSGNHVLNQSSQTVWLEVDGRVVTLAPGGLLNVDDPRSYQFYS